MNNINSGESFWGSPTSKANFCETDCAVSRYNAEFVNSLTNVVYSKLRRKASKHGNSLRTLPYTGLILVGLCSFGFHVSLKYHTQMMDDLSMHFPTTPVPHRVLTANSHRRDSVFKAIVLGSMLLLLVTFHMITDELILHYVDFNLGYWLWLVDHWACGYLTRAREAIGLPWAFVLELHGWWHICTGIGAYIFIAVVDRLVSGEYLSDIYYIYLLR
ncbi:ceramidase [Aspergillus tetrazonus]